MRSAMIDTLCYVCYVMFVIYCVMTAARLNQKPCKTRNMQTSTGHHSIRYQLPEATRSQFGRNEASLVSVWLHWCISCIFQVLEFVYFSAFNTSVVFTMPSTQ